MAKFTIPGRLPSLNEQFRTGSVRSRFYRSRLRQEHKAYIGSWIVASKVPVFGEPVDVRIRWVEKDKRRDYDNISSGAKMILDALVKTNRIKGDSRKWVYPVVHEYAIDKSNPRIEVTIDVHLEA